MGIKGIYSELGPAKRVALSKLAADKFNETQRPIRIAIDFAIWHFQSQAARGGTNPAIRTLFYRLTRLLGTPVQPVFVFDGPNKPAIKRNKRSGRGDGVAVSQAKELIRCFGFMVHDAPGEAEAECALLQRHGIVDAVLSEDVDTIMFGCTRTLRNWSAEGKSSKTPTHVSLYDVNEFSLASHGLDREGMVLVALMSGGDYLPEGIPGCGVKVACEAAKAGFGKSLCSLKVSDKDGFQQWRDKLGHELSTNEQGYFRTRHKKLVIPDDFPNVSILRYYTHPVVSPSSKLDSIRDKFAQRRTVQVERLREFARDTFGWDFKIGAIKFIRVLSPALLVHKMVHDRLEAMKIVKEVANRRTHFCADGKPELRISFIPEEVVPVDLQQEVDEEIPQSRDALALNSDEELDAAEEGIEASQTDPTKIFDVTKTDSTWVLEDIARHCVPKAVQDWEKVKNAKLSRKAPSKRVTTKTRGKGTKSSGTSRGAIDQFFRVEKPVSNQDHSSNDIPKEKTGGLLQSTVSPARHTSKPARPLDPIPGSSFTECWTIDSSPPATPDRPNKQHHDSEAIIISSSPAGAVFSQPPSPSPRRNATNGKPLASFRTFGTTNQSSQILKSATRVPRPKPVRGSLTGSQSETTGLKQLSIEAFTTRSVVPPASSSPGKPDHVEELHGQIACDLEMPSQPSSNEQVDERPESPRLPPSQPPPPKSPSKRLQSPDAADLNWSKNTSKKKVFVPRVSDVGFFKEVEVDAEEVTTAIAAANARLTKKGIRGHVVRWSDVSLIDLTEDDVLNKDR